MRTSPLHPLLPVFLLSLGLPLAACGEKEEVDEDDGDDERPWIAAPCEDPTPITGSDGLATGYVECKDGSVDRPTATTVDPSHELPTCAGDETELQCTTDADCSDGPNGTCTSQTDEWRWDTGANDTYTFCGCIYSCESDADCDSGQACLPAAASMGSSTYNRCVTASCSTDADCGEGGACGVSTYNDGCGWDRQLACRTSADECRAASECDSSWHYCALPTWPEGETTWACHEQNCDIGRPLLVEDRPRTAPTVQGGGWSGPGGQGAHAHGTLTEAQRARLATHWARVAAMEHASVASFARFQLQLMALGAPAELLAEAQQAGMDEIVHAQLAYGLASRFAGQRLGPGPLELSGVALETDVEAVLRALVAEACVGETLGVAEAHTALQACEDAEICGVLTTVLADEQRHAALAWKTLRWILQQHPELTGVAAQAASEALARLGTSGSGPERTGENTGSDEVGALSDLGLLGARARQEARRQAARGLVMPLLRGVLGEAAAERPVARA